jgi:shikimate 5-dehydrogenase
VPRSIWFVGVNTQGSVALRASAGWMQALGVEAQLVGVDIAADSPADRYRALVDDFRRDGDVLGAVISGHKARMFEVARDRLDLVAEQAVLCQEISVLHRWHEQVGATAIEADSTREALTEIAGPAHWRQTGGHLFVLGAGGTASALLAALYAERKDREAAPRVVHLVDVVASRSRRLAEQLDRWQPGLAVTESAPTDAPAVLAQLPPGSLVVNATGIGKDTPGSPIPLPAPWPREAIFWEINYRGPLPLLADAKRAAAVRLLKLHDGWRLFLAGWSEALAMILHRSLSEADRTALECAAVAARE